MEEVKILVSIHSPRSVMWCVLSTAYIALTGEFIDTTRWVGLEPESTVERRRLRWWWRCGTAEIAESKHVRANRVLHPSTLATSALTARYLPAILFRAIRTAIELSQEKTSSY